MWELSPLIKGHDFSDHSGCVLFHTQTGEALSFSCSIDELLSNEQNTEIQSIRNTLLNKQFVHSS